MADMLGPYELLYMLGRGGMGTVYRGRDTRTGTTVDLDLRWENT